uniref:Uncharacterized protein n=1 Tax=Arundo donax TaxID=35708 RepID=A0A0A9GQU4_ARUDO
MAALSSHTAADLAICTSV